ncbi:hypothetical protein [Rhodococcus koreensis]|uniref:hypothetical protein n=1 Tax=Rhodococcus koreensis TaxID=99653 RepID=UPI0019808312|nr:hypothetical protein [Rhodococcus koreensis]QSE84751.1 hypothetical protein JWS14_39430 [Rhodococcus koreensis]
MSSQQRPRRFGYAVGAALIAIGVLVAITASVVFAVQLTGRAPTDDHSFGNDQATMVHVDAGGSKTIYTDTMYTNTTSDSSIRCSVSAAKPFPTREDTLYLSRSHFNIPVTQWRPAFSFTVKDSGDYTISCSGAPSDVRYGIGGYVTAGEFTYLLLAIGTGVVLVIAGIVTVIVTMVRRARVNQPPPMHYPPQWPPHS